MNILAGPEWLVRELTGDFHLRRLEGICPRHSIPPTRAHFAFWGHACPVRPPPMPHVASILMKAPAGMDPAGPRIVSLWHGKHDGSLDWAGHSEYIPPERTPATRKSLPKEQLAAIIPSTFPSGTTRYPRTSFPTTLG